jgi:class 3 adenylate cyclase
MERPTEDEACLCAMLARFRRRIDYTVHNVHNARCRRGINWGGVVVRGGSDDVCRT